LLQEQSGRKKDGLPEVMERKYNVSLLKPDNNIAGIENVF
jgi:hypothetical protein